MEIDVLSASVPVRDLDLSRAWYDRFFGRPADIVPNDDEVIWKATDTAWVNVIRDGPPAGHGVVTLAVSNLDDATSALATRGVTAGPIEQVGDAGRKAVVLDPTETRWP
jgi:hypothetical protein